MAQDGATHRRVDGVDDPLITSYGRLVEVARRLDRTFAASVCDATGLPDTHFEVLLRLGRSPGEQLTMSALAAQLGVTSGGATRLVDRVAAVGLVERRACATDRRVSYVGLTERGREQLAAALDVHRGDLQHELGARLRPSELATLDRILDRLRTCADVAGSDEPSR